jgi:hypothetical protein
MVAADGRSTSSLGTMRQPYARVLLAGAYLVILVELLLPVLANPRDVPSPIAKAAAVSFVVWNLVTLAVLRPRRGLLILAALNAVLGFGTIIAGAAVLVVGKVWSWEVDGVVPMIFFVCLAPLVTGAFFYAEGRRPAGAPNYRLERP